MLVLSRLNLGSPPFTFSKVQGEVSSSKSSNGFWWSCQYGRPNIWLSQPSDSPTVDAIGTTSIPHAHSIPISWCRGSGGCANANGIACLFCLNKPILTWKILSNCCPLLRAKSLNQSDQIVVFLSGPWPFFPWIRVEVHLLFLSTGL